MNADDAGIRYLWETPPASGEAIEVAPGILWMRLALPMRLDHVNVYALDEGAQGWTLIDTGFDSRRTRAEWEMLLAGPLGGRPASRLVVTHYHPDHIGLAGWFRGQGAELLTTRTSWLFARMLVLDEHPLPLPETLDFWRAAGMDAALFVARSVERPFNFADCVHPLPLGYTRIAEGGTIRMGGRLWDIRCGDGHAPEHATFWSRDDDLVIGGDQLLPSISANIGAYPSEPDADPLAEYLASCRRFQPLAEARHLVLPGHKLPYTGLPLRLEQMIGNHLGALERLREKLREPATAAECFQTLFLREIGPSEYGLALVEAVAHINHLWKAGAITRDRREDGAWLWQSEATRR